MNATTLNGERRLRADAQYNHDRLLQVAARHFAAAGTGASMKAIAQEAGVGIGTLYRRFPSREILIEAAYRRQSQRLADAAHDLVRERPALDALRAWSEQFLNYMATQRGLADSLRILLLPDERLRLKTRQMLVDSLALLLRAGEHDGVLRTGLDAADVAVALGGLAMITGEEPQPGLRDRLLDLFLHGLTGPACSTTSATA